MQLPTDRGYAVMTELADGTNRVDIYATLVDGSPAHLFATYSSVDVEVLTAAAFPRLGNASMSSEPVAVAFSSEENKLYVMDLAPTSHLLA